MSKIRALQIISGFAIEGPLGGIERFGVELAQALQSRGLVAPLVCGMWAYDTPYEQDWLERLQRQGVDAFMPASWDESSPYRSFMRAYAAVRQHLRGQRVDIIHSHCQFGDVLALLLKRELGARLVFRTVHNEHEWLKRPLRRWLLTGFLYPLLFKAEMGVSQKVVDNLNRRRLGRRRPAILAYNALNLSRFANKGVVDKAAKRASLNLPPDGLLIGSVGRLTRQKGYDVLLEAAVLTRQERPQAHFVIVGDGELASPLRQQAAALGLTPHVTFTGPRPDVEEILPLFDLFVNSSRWEGLPTVMMESMAAGVPVAATRVSGNVELIQDRESGWLVPPEDPQQLAAVISESLALKRDAREQMCRRAYQFVQDNFSIVSVAAQYETLYLHNLQPGASTT
jgi:glycosyltransferase involved in cell wall biosynthesis